ncbi:hypothetical protein HK100_002438 [Physocladia obscura]|uniref:Uncharacterized protein n=1 Tax=Physocladia obscura TaxID=109957 RepID=A0AAD5XLE4_9FUNG|nr:hypothetical protein HK100_002438 [Physocladia obscura]
MSNIRQPGAIQQAFSKLNGTLKTVFKSKKKKSRERVNNSSAATQTSTPTSVNEIAQAKQQIQPTEQQQQIFSSPPVAAAAEAKSTAVSEDYVCTHGDIVIY